MAPVSRSWCGVALLSCGSVFFALLPGCSSLLPSASSVIPNQGKDPTPLGKCSVAMSQSRPLVTEWPASEKSRLEALIARGGVAVSYSGCEMRLIESCTFSGNYTFQKTTLAVDQVEIRDEDELYGKLPLGAVRLEGDLKRAGRLAVKTTVAGQYLLSGGPANLPTSGACAEATHIITGMSVGAFKLLAGGKVSGSAGVSTSGVGVGSSGAREEVTLTEAGSEKSCAESQGNEAPAQCRSPIQLFLQKIRSSDPPGLQRPTSTAVLIDAKMANSSERWSLNRGSEQICSLPCKTWIEPDSGQMILMGPDAKLELKPRNEWRGRTVQIDVNPSKGSYTGLAAVGGTFGVAGMAVMLGGFMAFSSSASDTDAERDANRAKQLAFFGSGFGLWVVGGGLSAWYYLSYMRNASYDTLLIETRASLLKPKIAPGGLMWGARDSAHVMLWPGGLVGRF